MLYYVTIGERTLEVDLGGDQALVDGEAVDAAVTTIPGTDLRHLFVGSDSHALLASAGSQKGEWSVLLGGQPFTVEVIDERTRTIREMAGAAAGEVEKVVAAPMPGLIVRVEVEIGDAVTAGQGMVVVEAMKMENELKAPADGVVSRIEVSAGDAVEKGAVLVVLE